jgi:hypothetical protein
MKDEMKEHILNELDPAKVGQAFTNYVVSQISTDEMVGFMEGFRERFRPFILKKLKEKSSPVLDGDEIVKQHKGNEIKRELEQASTRVMMDLEQMIEKMKLQKNDWLEIFSEIV